MAILLSCDFYCTSLLKIVFTFSSWERHIYREKACSDLCPLMSLICFKSSLPERYRFVIHVLLAVCDEMRRSLVIHRTTSFPPTILVVLILDTIPAFLHISFMYLLYPEMLIFGILPPYFIRIFSTSFVRRGMATSFLVFFCVFISAE